MSGVQLSILFVSKSKPVWITCRISHRDMVSLKNERPTLLKFTGILRVSPLLTGY